MKYYYTNNSLKYETDCNERIEPLVYFLDVPKLFERKIVNVIMGSYDVDEDLYIQHPLRFNDIIIRNITLTSDSWMHKKYLNISFQKRWLYNCWKTFTIENLKYENLIFFFDKVVPALANCSFYENYLLLFYIEKIGNEKIFSKDKFEHTKALINIVGLKDIEVSYKFAYANRVGRDDHAYEYYTIDIKSKSFSKLAFYYLVASENADSGEPTIVEESDTYKISFCFMFDDNAYPSEYRGYHNDTSHQFKEEIMSELERYYWLFFEKFKEVAKKKGLLSC